MQIHGLEFGSDITVKLKHKNGTNIPLLSKVCDLTNEVFEAMNRLSCCTQVPFTMIDGCGSCDLANMRSSGWEVSVCATVADKYYEFELEDIKSLKLPSGRIVFIVFDKDNVEYHERRGAYRLQLNVLGLLISPSLREPIHIKVKDLSVTGIGVIIPNGVRCEKGDLVNISFRTDGVPQFVRGQVVRIAKDEDGLLLGCKICSEDLC